VLAGNSYLILRNGSHSGYVCFGAVSNGVRVSVAETFAGVSSGHIVGDGAKSGSAAGSTVPHLVNILRFTYSTNSCSWYMVADEKTFVLALASPGASATNLELTGANGNNYTLNTLYVGEDSLGNFIACGGVSTTSTSSTVSGDWGEGFTALRNPDTGLLVDTDPLVYSLPGCYYGEVNSFSRSQVFPEAAFSKMLWAGELGAMAAFRGIAVEARTMTMHCSDSAQALGLGHPLMSRTAYESVELGDGYRYMVSPRYRKYGPTFFLTDNPEFW
jgi:hypothetical protein